MELGEAGKEAKGETTAMVSIYHLIFKIFNLFVCLFVCPLVFYVSCLNYRPVSKPVPLILLAHNWGRLLHRFQFRACLPWITNG